MENFPSEIDPKALLHLRLQAIIRENNIPTSELMYLGEREGDHWYLIDGQHEVPVTDIEDIEEVDEDSIEAFNENALD